MELQEEYRTVIQAMRKDVIEQVKVTVMLQRLLQEGLFTPDMKDCIMLEERHEAQMAVCLDFLVTRGQRAYDVLIQLMDERYPHLGYLMREEEAKGE